MIKVIYNEGAWTGRFIPRDRSGKPSRILAASVDYSIEDLRVSEDASDRVVASGNPTLGSVDTTLSAAAGPEQSDPTAITVADGTGITVGRTYLISKADGQRELVTVKRASGTSVYATRSLRNDYASADLFQAIELEVTFSASEANDENKFLSSGGPYAFTFEFTIAGEYYKIWREGWIGRYNLVPWLTTEELFRPRPSLSRRLSGSDSEPEEFIRAAMEDFVGRAEAAGVDPSLWQNSRAAMIAIRARSLEYIFREFGTERDDDAADLWAERWDAQMATMFTGQAVGKTAEIAPSTNTSREPGYGAPVIERM